MRSKKDTLEIISRLKSKYPYLEISLNFKNPYELIIATALSAQCTDIRVNKVTEVLFLKYPTVYDLASARYEDVEKIVRPTGFYKNKASNIIATAQIICDEFEGKVPSNMDDLIKLKGVARKTANIVLYKGYGIIDGIAIDTHARRLANRLGFVKSDNQSIVEQKLQKQIPKSDWGEITNLFISHGRNICQSRTPKCEACFLSDVCPSYKKFMKLKK